jgi:hypothetical protein
MTRPRLVATIIAVAIVTAIWGLLPRTAVHLVAAPDPGLVHGVVHVHTTRSDGAGTPDDVASAARRAGLDFVVLTDHGDGLRRPEAPRYSNGVLLIDGVEISTASGHYVALGIGQAPYRLAGDARDVIEDVRRLGGFGFAAHPDSPKPALRWRDWSVAPDGLEWLNADSEWRHETRGGLARAFATYWFRGPESIVAMFDRPVVTLARWNQLTAQQRTVGIAGNDAHARLPLEPGAEPGDGPALGVPSYESSFRAMSVGVRVPGALGRTAASANADAEAILSGIRAGHVFSVIDGLAGPAALEFTADTAAGHYRMGDDVVANGAVTLTAQLTPPVGGASLVVFKNGEERSGDAGGGSAVHVLHDEREDPAVYRVEVRLAGAPGTPPIPWIVSNPIYVRRSPRPGPSAEVPYDPVHVLTDTASSRPWSIEKQPASQAHVEQGPAPDGTSAAHFAWRLADGTPSGQYAALALPVTRQDFDGAEAISIALQAPRPMRLSVQLRAPDGEGLRWQRSVYVDRMPRAALVPLAAMAPIEGGPGSRLDLSRVNTLLLVVDTVNATPGSAGECWVGRVTTAGPATATSAR